MSQRERNIHQRREARGSFGENKFGFRNQQYRSYMLLVDTNWVSPDELLSLSAGMKDKAKDHPLVASASGWAAASAALHRDSFTADSVHQLSVLERLGALHFASKMWKLAEKDFEKARMTTADPEDASELLGFELRTSQALAYLPNFYLAANWFGGNELPEQEIKDLTQLTRSRLIQLAGEVDKIPHSQFTQRVKSGVNSEILTPLLASSSPSCEVIFLPASIQQDNNNDEDKRADLVAVTRRLGHRSDLIQVTADLNVTKTGTKRRMYVRTHKDLVLKGHRVPRSTLEALLKRERGGSLDMATNFGLNQLAADLANRANIRTRY
jgi:hypothetical protein